MCPRISDPFYIVSYNIKWITTFWTHSSTSSTYFVMFACLHCLHLARNNNNYLNGMMDVYNMRTAYEYHATHTSIRLFLDKKTQIIRISDNFGTTGRIHDYFSHTMRIIHE